MESVCPRRSRVCRGGRPEPKASLRRNDAGCDAVQDAPYPDVGCGAP